MVSTRLQLIPFLSIYSCCLCQFFQIFLESLSLVQTFSPVPLSWVMFVSLCVVVCIRVLVCMHTCVCIYVYESLTSKCMYVLKIRKVLKNFFNWLGYACLDVLNRHCYDYKNIMQTCKNEVWSTLFSDVWNLVVATTLNDTAQEPQVKIQMVFDSGRISCHCAQLGSVKKVIIMTRDLLSVV